MFVGHTNFDIDGSKEKMSQFVEEKAKREW